MERLTRFPRPASRRRLWLFIAALMLVRLTFLFYSAGDVGPARHLVAGNASAQPGVFEQDAAGGTFHTWLDGDRTTAVDLLSGEEITQGASAEEISVGGRRLKDFQAGPAFLAETGGHPMTLAAGALVALEPLNILVRPG